MDNIVFFYKARLIVVGFDPMTICDEKEATGTIKFNKPLHNVFLEFGVVSWTCKLIQLVFWTLIIIIADPTYSCTAYKKHPKKTKGCLPEQAGLCRLLLPRRRHRVHGEPRSCGQIKQSFINKCESRCSQASWYSWFMFCHQSIF